MSKPTRPHPPPPPNPWEDRAQTDRPTLISASIWPYRLLHVNTMTSYIRQGEDVYNGVKAPQYNILSYTWGFYKDVTATPILVHGLDWPVPGVQKSHFTAETFHNMIMSAARGVKHPCEWLWVDIACIPQRHDGETKEAAVIRGEEIGRKVEIFHRAKEAFAWFSSLKKIELLEGNESLVMLFDILTDINAAWRRHSNAQQVTNFLDGLEGKTQLYQQWMKKVMSHSWLQSLWTLQEMVLRSDTYILFDDGLMQIHDDAKVDGQGNPVSNRTLWHFGVIKNDAWTVRLLLRDKKRWDRLEEVKSKAVSVLDSKESHPCRGQTARIRRTLQSLLDLQDMRGLTALKVDMPNTAYSASQYRRVKRTKDRIYGIVQLYGISCNPDPPGS